MRWDYWNGPDEEDRRIKYAKSFKPEFQGNGDNLQLRFRTAISYVCGQHEIILPTEEWASGWRSPEVNEATANAAKLSTHLTAEAGDRKDNVNGELCWALMKDTHPLEVNGLYMEHPVATLVRSWERAYQQHRDPTPWCHAQTRAPASHLRCYWPDFKAEPEWNAFLAMGGYVGISYADWKVLRALRDEPPAKKKKADA